MTILSVLFLCCCVGLASGQQTTPSSNTLSDDKISATFGSSPGLLSELKMVGGKSVVANTTKGNVWYAFFVGPHGAKGSITSSSKCNRTEVTRLPTPALALSFKWIDCELPFDNEETNAHDDPPASWVKHEHSTCGGRCLSKHSNGPRGGNCDRMPGCGHDAGLPYCEPDAMKARCLNASGCTAFNTNGYLYAGNRVDAFNAYPLDCYTYGPPPPPPALINVTLTATLRDGILEYGIAFD